MPSLGVLSRNWKALCLLLGIFFVFYIGLYPLVLSNFIDATPTAFDHDFKPTAVESDSDSDSDATAPISEAPSPAPTEFPFAASRHSELPLFVNFSHRTDLAFDATQAPNATILVFDVQWVPTVSAIVVLISDRIVYNSRNPPLLGDRALNNSAFFPNVTVIAQSLNSSSPPSLLSDSLSVQCTDLEKYAPTGEILPSETLGLPLSVVVCNLPMDFRDSIVRASDSAAIDSLLVKFPDLTVELSLANPTASKYFKRTTRRNPPSFNEPKRTAGICIVGMLRPGIKYAREIVQYHLTSGMSHVYLSYTGDMVHFELLETRRPEIMSALRELELTLADYISEGKVSVILAPGLHPDVRGEEDYVDLYAKIPFLQSCLWHSKAYDNYTAVMDFDEIVLINDTKKPNITTAIATFLEKQQAMKKPAPQCVMVLDQFNSCRGENNPFLLGFKFMLRETHNYALERNSKSIALTQRAKYLGLHSHGSCLPLLPAEKQDKLNGSIWNAEVGDRTVMMDLNEPNRNLDAIAYNFFSLHFRHMYGVRDLRQCDRPGGNTTNEYTTIWFLDVRRELERRCSSLEPVNNNSYLAEHCQNLRNPFDDGNDRQKKT